jgi:threonine dehydrogenase-like Zn-dependent dehydrogenase
LYGGICNTDLELQRGYYDFRGIPGHEFVGEVVAADDQKWVGKRVVGEINLACGKCESCKNNLGRHCLKRKVLGIVKNPGAFREFLTLPEANLHAVPHEIPTEHAVFVEPLAAACEILDQVRIPAGAPVAVLGDGKLGLLIGQVLKAHGAEVHQYGRHKEKLKIATNLGIDARLARKLPAARYDWVVDASGSNLGLWQAVRMTKPRGTVVLKSTVHGLVGIDSAAIVVNEITLVGSRCGRFEPALRLLRSGRVRVDNLISEIFPLERAPLAFKKAAAPGILKVLLHG